MRSREAQHAIDAREAINARVSRVWKSLRQYDEGDDLNIPVRDILADLRHYCDVYGIDFADEDRIAHGHYLAEIGGEL